MKTQKVFYRATLLLATMLGTTTGLRAQSELIAFDASVVAAGNEPSGVNPIGYDFRVIRPVVISQLGMFDSGGDGVAGSSVITIQLHESSPENKGSSLLESITFDAGSPGKLVGSFRYKPLSRSITLLPGHYTLTAEGFDERNPEYNAGRPRSAMPPRIVVNNGGGAIQFLGCFHRNDVTVRSKELKNLGAPDHFAAGTFMFSVATLPASPFAGDYTALTAGVKSFPIDSGRSNVYAGQLVLNRWGSIALLNERSFPVLMEPSGNRLIFEAAGYFNGDRNGARAVAFAHEQFGHAPNDGRMALFENAIKWAARKSRPSDIVLVLTTNLDANYFSARGYQVRLADRNMKTNDANPMIGADVLAGDLHGGYTERFMARAGEFAAQGGGLVITFLPWRYVHTEIRPMFTRVNTLLSPFGLAYRSSLVSPVDFGFTTVQEVPYAPVLFNAFPAAALLRQHRLGRVQLSALEKSIALNTIAYAADHQPDTLAALTEVYSGTPNNFSGEIPAGGPSNFVDVVTLSGAQAGSNWLGGWSVDKADLVAMDGRGAVEYTFEVPAADVYRIQISGSQNQRPSSVTNFDLALTLDGVWLGHRHLLAPNGASGHVAALTPYLLAGTHKLRIFWDNPSPWSQLRLQSVQVQSSPGPDADGDGVKDWVSAWVNGQSGLDGTNRTLTSYVSPVSLEGRDPFPELIAMEVSGADVKNPKLKPSGAPDGRWSVDVPLASVGATALRVGYQNGAKTEVRQLQWLPVNVLDGGTFTIRKNDQLALVVRPSGPRPVGEVQFTIGTNELPRRNITSPLVHEFGLAGRYVIKGTYAPDGAVPQTGTITVNVVEQRFTNTPACWVGSERQWNVLMPAGATLESDARLFFETFAQAGRQWQNHLVIDQSEARYVLSRLSADGPILDSAAARGFNFWSGKETSVRVVQTYEDKSELVEMLLIESPVLPDITVKIDLIVGGVVFEDGTITRELKASDFDELGRCAIRFIRPASAKTSVCHSINLYQGSEIVGYVR